MMPTRHRDEPSTGNGEAAEHLVRLEVTEAKITWALDQLREMRDKIDDVDKTVALLDQTIRTELLAETANRRAAEEEARDQRTHRRKVVLKGIEETCATARHGIDRLTPGRTPQILAFAFLVLSVGFSGVALTWGNISVVGQDRMITDQTANVDSADAEPAGAGLSEPAPEP